MFPYVPTDYEYITITKGKGHILTAIDKHGHIITSFYYDHMPSHCNATEILKQLKRKVTKFIVLKGIFLNTYGDKKLKEIICQYSNIENKWACQFSFKTMKGTSTEVYYSDTAKNVDELIDEVNNIFPVKITNKTANGSIFTCEFSDKSL